MSAYQIKLSWKRETPDFDYDTYDRSHQIQFGGGTLIHASAAPEFKGNENVNPEEMLAAALSSCHMLTFLAIAARSRLIVDSYDDEATAHLDKNAEGKLAVTKVVLRPRVHMRTAVPEDRFRALHQKSHEGCFLARSVKCDMAIEAVQVTS